MASKTALTATTDRNRELAYQHATLLQQRKDTESSILEALEELIDFPLHPKSEASKPDATDIERFQNLVAAFQVSDYDALIEERNCAGKCAYVFCPSNLKRSDPSGNYSRILRGAVKDGSANHSSLKIVSNGKVEMWCDPFCAKAAMFLKVQFSQTPAWERDSRSKNRIVLYSDRSHAELATEVNRATSGRNDDEEMKDALAELTLERGQRPGPAFMLPLRERAPGTTGPAHPPTESETDREAGDIEGYVVKLRPHNARKNGKVDHKDVDGDWDLP